MFSGVNLASGGASQEYGEGFRQSGHWKQKITAKVDKVGGTLRCRCWWRGTKTFDRGSLSVDLNYQNLGLYDKVYSGRRDFEKPYRMFSGLSSSVIPLDASGMEGLRTIRPDGLFHLRRG